MYYILVDHKKPNFGNFKFAFTNTILIKRRYCMKVPINFKIIFKLKTFGR